MLKPKPNLRLCYTFNMKLTTKHRDLGFTIVELLVVIVVIGILATITIISYTGISQKATAASLQSDLTNASKQLKIFQVDNSNYPATIRCDIADSNVNKCLKASSGNSFAYLPSNTANPQTFLLTATNSSKVYSLTNDSAPAAWITIGTQTWAPANLNVGVMVPGATNQTNNSIVEKYCYADNEANCTIYGGFYQWDEMMQYSATPDSPPIQGICPDGSHIPTDTELKTLEKSLGMDQTTADLTGWRGTDQGTQLKPGGSSGLNLPLAGYRFTAGSFVDLGVNEYIWTSTQSGASAWKRSLRPDYATVNRDSFPKTYGFSVRCLKN